MDREGAETYLRLLAEAAMRGSLAPAAEPGPPGASRMMVVGHALTAVGALDPVVTEEILTDFRLAVSVRHLHNDPGQGPGQAVTVAQWLSQGRAVLHRKPHQAPPPATAPAGRYRSRRHRLRRHRLRRHRLRQGRTGMTPARTEP